MPTSLFDAEVSNILDPATWVASGASLTPSPADWRDHWIYFLLVDRFNNPSGPPPVHQHSPATRTKVEVLKASKSNWPTSKALAWVRSGSLLSYTIPNGSVITGVAMASQIFSELSLASARIQPKRSRIQTWLIGSFAIWSTQHMPKRSL